MASRPGTRKTSSPVGSTSTSPQPGKPRPPLEGPPGRRTGTRSAHFAHVCPDSGHTHRRARASRGRPKLVAVRRTGGSTSVTTATYREEQEADQDEFGDEQLQLWRRSYDTPPPALTPDNPTRDERPSLPRSRSADIPTTECLADVVRRVLPYWESEIVPDLRNTAERVERFGGRSWKQHRALRKHLEGISDATSRNLKSRPASPFGSY